MQHFLGGGLDCLGIPVFRRCLMPQKAKGIKQRRNTGMPKQSKPPPRKCCMWTFIRIPADACRRLKLGQQLDGQELEAMRTTDVLVT